MKGADGTSAEEEALIPPQSRVASPAADVPSPVPASARAAPAPDADAPSLLCKLTAILSWFVLNIMIASINKWVISVDHFEYPALLTLIHMICSCMLSAISLATCLPPERKEPPRPETLDGVRKLSVTFCASVFFGNQALAYVEVSLKEMVTAASPLMTMLLAIGITGKRYSGLAYWSMLPMCGGVMLCVKGELGFSWVGLALIVASTALRGVKSIMQGTLLTNREDKLDSLSLLYHMSKYSIVMLAAYAIAAGEVADAWRRTDLHQPYVGATVLASGIVAFQLNVCNFLVTKYTSAVTLQVLGNVKVVLSIGISLLIFGNPISMMSAIGCVVTLGGVALYQRSTTKQPAR